MVPDIRNISDEIHTLEIHLKYAKKDKNRVVSNGYNWYNKQTKVTILL
jgi:hypothetical protein